MKQYFDLKGRVAIVTGCSGGLGVQMAKALANQGAIIVPIARRQQKIEEVAAEIHEGRGDARFTEQREEAVPGISFRDCAEIEHLSLPESDAPV